ncbi:MAG TPA: VOC family protein [Acidimicrobiales bacterium]|nr:VOC family protein [Acidimicrobiales bacterium]
MPTFSSYPSGTPSWVDLSTPDPGAAHAFYGSVFGWTAADLGPDAGGYAMFQLGGANVAGVGPTQAEGQPAAWTTYVDVADAEATMARVAVEGGTVVLEPTAVMEAGTMALFTDPTGAFLGIWQPGQHRGADVANEPGTWCWNELNTRDLAKATRFYERVFDWVPVTSDAGGVQYTEWKLGGRSVAGMMAMPAQVPAEAPAHWLAYFAVADTDATVAAVEKGGGSVFVPPTDIPPGRFAVLADPAGAAFAVIKTAAS